MLGWAADWRVVIDAADALPPDFDALAIYDYRECDCGLEASGARPDAVHVASGGERNAITQAADVLSPYAGGTLSHILRTTLTAYSNTCLFAWSFGVMMAERIFGEDRAYSGVAGELGKEVAGHRFTHAVAINGTPRPVDEHFGIEPRRMAATLRGLARGGMDAFERKTYAEHYGRLRTQTASTESRGTISPRSLEDNIHELNVLCELAEQEREHTIKWDEAVVGTRDEIFLPQNQLSFWGSLAKELPLPHYPFGDAHFFADMRF